MISMVEQDLSVQPNNHKKCIYKWHDTLKRLTFRLK